jgi:hypothetical protein
MLVKVQQVGRQELEVGQALTIRVMMCHLHEEQMPWERDQKGHQQGEHWMKAVGLMIHNPLY